MNRLLIVSNRLPVSIEVNGDGFRMEPSVGGLATGLRSFYRKFDSRWIGWSGIEAETEEELDGLEEGLMREKCVPVSLPRRLLDGYYYGFSNRTVWPLFHYFQQFAEFSWEQWDAYREANRKFADVILEHARPGDSIWIHDYHLMLLPGLLKEKLPDCSIGFFLHIPFPSYELIRLLPWRDELIEGLLGADLVGFHSYDYARHFLSSVLRLKGYDRSLNRLNVKGRQVRVDVFPIGIDFDKFSEAQSDPGVAAERKRVRKKTSGKKLILSVDRLDYTKGIINRLEAFELFLRENPDYRPIVRLVLLVVPSRTKVPQYRQLKTELDRMVGGINSRYGDVTGGPIAYIFNALPFEELAALYGEADVGLVTPIRDGMNLVAKEYVASQTEDHGMLVLSEMAGAVMELSEALLVNPNNTPQVADAIKRALEMSPDEKRRRIESMQQRLRRYDVTRWAEDFIGTLDEVRSQQEEDRGLDLGEDDRKTILNDYERADSRLVLLNYDGTLVPSGMDLQQVAPDAEMKQLLSCVRDTEGTQLVIFSGRKRESLEGIFEEREYDLIAEGGFWLRGAGCDWRMIAPLSDRWKEDVRPLMEYYLDRTPGAFLEEKDFSLILHYRKTEPALAEVRENDLLLALYAQTANMDLEVLRGAKHIEVRNSDVSKGRAVQHWLEKRIWGMIVAAGDDTSDESVFNSLPGRSYTLKIGPGPTEARYRVSSPYEMKRLLMQLSSTAYSESG